MAIPAFQGKGIGTYFETYLPEANMKNLEHFPLAMLLLSLTSPFAIAQEERTEPNLGEVEAETMEAWSAAAEVGEQHLWLSKKTGEWEAEMELWMDPDEPPMTGTASVSRQMELGGRVLLEYWNGEAMGDKFEGVGRTGYNNVTDQYWSTWTDTMSTGLFESHGTAVEGTDQLTLKGDYIDPQTNETVATRYVWLFPGTNREIMEAYESRGGEEVLVMRITMARTATD
ncbi:MAG: DUF1579 family protein [Candidatus Wenzhouxiangella sp. M2_3B_020]